MVNSSWGDQARGGNRFVAFDGKTGQVVWWAEAGRPDQGHLLLEPGRRGHQRPAAARHRRRRTAALHAFKVRTGERVWSYQLQRRRRSTRRPVVDGNLVYCAHGEENPEGGPHRPGRLRGRLARSTPRRSQPKLVWEYSGSTRQRNRFGRFGSPPGPGRRPAVRPGRRRRAVLLRRQDRRSCSGSTSTAREVRGAPLVADGKLYVFDVKAKLLILKLDGRTKSSRTRPTTFEYRSKSPGRRLVRDERHPDRGQRPASTSPPATRCTASATPEAKAECGQVQAAGRPRRRSTRTPRRWRSASSPPTCDAKPGEKVAFKAVVPGRQRPRAAGAKPTSTAWSGPAAAAARPRPAPQPPALNGKVEATAAAPRWPSATQPSQQGYVDVEGRRR